MIRKDPRLTPSRPHALRRARVAVPIAGLYRASHCDSPLETQALYGETVAIYEEYQGFVGVQLERDSYVGYLESSTLSALEEATHHVIVPRTHIYAQASIKSRPLWALSLGARVHCVAEAGAFWVDSAGRYIFARHIAPIDFITPDYMQTAEMFLNTPYLWGGRTCEGIDCSGLVQTALRAAGFPAPRDSDMLEALGAPAEPPLRRGDLVFWKGHVGMMQDEHTLLHANAWHMSVASEKLEVACQRIAAKGGGNITAMRRLG